MCIICIYVCEYVYKMCIYIYIHTHRNICIYSPDTAFRESDDIWCSYLKYILGVF